MFHTRGTDIRRLTFVLVVLTFSVFADHFKVHKNVPVSSFPEELRAHADRHPLDVGYIDVTAPPYNCDSSGIKDVTQGLRKAIEHAYWNNLAVYFPAGIYLCSGELECSQTSIPGAGWSQRKFGHILIGAVGGPHPVLKLADNASLKEGIFVDFEWRGIKRGKPSRDAACHYVATFRGIDIDMGNNPGKTAIVNKGHQHCVIEDVHIYGRDFGVGVASPPGCGGSIGNIKISGGDIGIEMRGYRPVPLFTCVTLVDQTMSAVVVGGNTSPVTMVGFDIRGASSDGYRAIDMQNTHGGMNLVDGRIELTGTGGTAVRNEGEGGLVMSNVFVKADIALDYTLDEKERRQLPGSSKEWHVFSVTLKSGERPGYIHLNGIENRTTQDGFLHQTVARSVPPDDLLSRHQWPSTPDWKTAVNITQYGATPDDPSDDDAIAIQKAIDANSARPVLIPRGHFHVAQPLIIRPGTLLIGTAKTFSVIHASERWRPQGPCYILDTPDIPGAGIYLDSFAVDNHRAGDELDGNRGHFRLRLPNSVVRDVQIVRQGGSGTFGVPSVIIEGNGGGRIYNFSNDDGAKHNVMERYHKLAVRNTAHPLALYAVSIEHQEAGVSQIGLSNARDVTIYALKFESASIPLVSLEQCTNVSFIGMYGNIGSVSPGRSLIEIQKSSGIILANLTRNKARNQYVAEKLWLAGDTGTVPGSGPIVLFR